MKHEFQGVSSVSLLHLEYGHEENLESIQTFYYLGYSSQLS